MTQNKDILEKLEDKENMPEDFVDYVLANRNLINVMLEGISSSQARVRFGSAKILRIVSEKNPEAIYPHMDFFIDLLDSENNILRWIALDVIASLTSVDNKNKFDDIFQRYYDFLSDESMVTAAHVIDNSGKIACAKPYLKNEVTNNLLRVENIPRNKECRNILLGKAILSFEKYFDQIEDKKKIITFVERQKSNPRNATKKKAEKFLAKVNSKV
ncbi:MAG: hypothetical protein JSW00_03655 [Thermoplasmata archaeon]|nr:MAG: hypothetical protein JSW00_03655 [Thermoplasmata archaeon]